MADALDALPKLSEGDDGEVNGTGVSGELDEKCADAGIGALALLASLMTSVSRRYTISSGNRLGRA
jgi:hypothetical protein